MQNKDQLEKYIYIKNNFDKLLTNSVFDLSVFFNVSGIWFLNKGPIKDKAFWPVLVFRKGLLSFKKLFLKLILPSGANSKTSFK